MFWGVQVEPGKQYTQVAVADIHISGACLGHSLNTKGGINGRTTLFIVAANIGGAAQNDEDVSDISGSDEDMSGSDEDDGGKSSSYEDSGSSAVIESGSGSEMEEGERAVYALATLVPGTVENAQLSHHITEGETFTFFTSGKETVHVTGFYMIDDNAGDGDESSDEYRFRDSDDESIDSDLANDAIAGSDSEDDTFKPAGGADDDDDDEDDMDSDQDISSSEFDAILRDANKGGKGKKEAAAAASKASSKRKASKEEETPAPSAKKAKKAAEPKKKEPAAKAPKTPAETAKPKQAAKEPKAPATPKKVKDKSGLEYVVTHPGRGKAARSNTRVQVHYTGRLTNGKVFDSSRRGRGKPFGFHLGRGEVIRGWDIGVQGMVVGEKRTLTIPPHLGYGSRGAPPDIPPNATLKFDVELMKA